MIKDISIGQYIPGESILHRADPRTKIILTFVFMIVIFLISSFLGFVLMSLFTLLSIIISGVPVKTTLRGLKPLLVIIIFASIVNIVTTEGRPVIDYGILSHITYEGIFLAAKFSVRLALVIIIGSLLTFTTTPILLTDGIEKMLQPFKRIGLPAHELAMMMTIALRFIPTLLEETDKIMKAQAARGADFDSGNVVKRAKSYIPVLVPLFVSAFRRADELATAMEARCYRGSEGRTRMRQIKFTRVDLAVMSATIIFMAAQIYIEILV